MKQNRFKNLLGRGMHITFYVLIVVMAFCTGLLLKQVFTHENAVPYKQLRKAEPVHEQAPLITLSEDPAEESGPSGPETIDLPFLDMLNNAVQAGGDFLSELIDTLISSETGKQMFSEEERKELEDLSQLTNDMIDLLTNGSDNPDSGS